MASYLTHLTGIRGLRTMANIIDEAMLNAKFRSAVFDRDDKTNEFLGYSCGYRNPKDPGVIDEILAFSFKNKGVPTHLVEEHVTKLLETHREIWWSAQRRNKRVSAAYIAFVRRLEKEGYRTGIGKIRDFKLLWRAVRFNLKYFYVKAKF
jgi:hypothetical protein